MKTMKLLHWMILIMPLLLLGCKGDEPELAPLDQLPPATRIGEYTFGCLVNGEVRIAKNTSDIRAIYQRGILQVYGEFDLDPGGQDIGIIVSSNIGAGRSYDLTNPPFEEALFDWGEGNGVGCRYESENTLSGTLTITRFDDKEYIISGTFEFTTATEGCDTIRVTDGRFDIP